MPFGCLKPTPPSLKNVTFGYWVLDVAVALPLKGSDPGLRANLALLLAGDLDEALDHAEQAVARGPRDEISREIAKSPRK